MTRRSLAAPRTPAAVVVALALAASASVGALPAQGPVQGSTTPLERVVVTGLDAAGSVLRAGGEVLDSLPLVGGVGALLPRGAQLPPTVQVVPDRALSVQSGGAADSRAAVSTVRATLGLGHPAGEGAGVTVAVVDTGVAKDLPDLAGRVDHVSVVGSPGEDGLGHGTFIAGLVASSGASTGGRTAGVAPGARILDVKVADEDGSTSLLAVLRGLQAVHAHGDVDVVNLSLSSDSPLPAGLDPLSVALSRLWADGTTVVVPSGNDGGTVSSPGDDPTLLTVGGLAEAGTADRGDDSVATWSGRGGDKPDLVAPGQSVVSLLAPGSQAAKGQQRTDLPDGHGVGSGTSFANAVTAGAAAVLLARRDLAPDQVKELLTDTAYRGSKALRAASGAGAGGLDLAAALSAKTPKLKPAKVDPVPAGDLAAWEAFVAAVLDGDAEAAASSWSDLSPQARTWVARTWVGLTPAARTWAARTWTARTWLDSPEGEDVWAARTWTARTWAARTWAAEDWTARTWTARTWTARTWTARTWSARTWSDSDWSARTWSARTWSARTWSATRWS